MIMNVFAKNYIRQFFLALLFTSVLVYFAWHILSGERSINALSQKKQVAQKLQGEYQLLEQQYQILYNRNILLRSPYISKDMLQQQIQKYLGYYAPDHYIVRFE